MVEPSGYHVWMLPSEGISAGLRVGKEFAKSKTGP